MEQKPSQRKVKCPQCGHFALFSSENPHRPFCSDRCRLIDLGQWAEGSYRIPTQDFSDLAEPGAEDHEDSH